MRQVTKILLILMLVFEIGNFKADEALAKLSSTHTGIDGISARRDGTKISWRIIKPLKAEKYPLVVLAQGSGCQSFSKSAGVSAFVKIFHNNYAILLVEKYGVKLGDNPAEAQDGSACTDEFNSRFSVQDRVDDYVKVLDDIKKEPWWNGYLTLIGGSESGLAMAMLSSKVRANAVVLLSSVGDQSFGEMIIDAMGDQRKEEVNSVFSAAKRAPLGTKFFAGTSFKYWAETTPLTPLSYLTSKHSSYLVVQGSANTQPRSEHARRTIDWFERLKRCNLTYWEMSGLDHSFADLNGRSHLDSVATQVRMWVDLISERTFNRSCE